MSRFFKYNILDGRIFIFETPSTMKKHFNILTSEECILLIKLSVTFKEHFLNIQ